MFDEKIIEKLSEEYWEWIEGLLKTLDGNSTFETLEYLAKTSYINGIKVGKSLCTSSKKLDKKGKTSEKWYDNFKKKYPKGVICWVSDDEVVYFQAIVVNYKNNTTHPFETSLKEYFKYAKPIKLEESPEIIGE